MCQPICTPDLLLLLAAIALAAFGGEAFLKGVLGVASHLRLPKLLVATTLAAFATSSPELTVSTIAALSGKPEIGLGDALGSNVVNMGLILGLVLLFGQLSVRYGEIRRDFLLALGIPVLTLFLARDGILSGSEGGLLLALFAIWLGLTAKQAYFHRKQNSVDTQSMINPARAWIFLLTGLAALILAGRLFVVGASGIASALGVHPYLIGAIIIAIGTSLPELVTTLLARLRGHDDVSLGTLLGSNLFNGLAIVGTAASIHPIRAPTAEVAVALGFGTLSVALVLPYRGRLSQQRGVLLLIVYSAFLGTSVAI